MARTMITRILWGGSRTLHDWDWVRELLTPLYRQCPLALLVHGGQVTEKRDQDGQVIDRWGADFLAHHVWGSELRGAVERNPADWRRWGRKAGPIRNWNMAAKGADFAVAALVAGRRCDGTRNMAECAARFGIHVFERTYPGPPTPIDLNTLPRGRIGGKDDG
jgi:hypothetical protein